MDSHGFKPVATCQSDQMIILPIGYFMCFIFSWIYPIILLGCTYIFL
jgi:hypothetical protein